MSTNRTPLAVLLFAACTTLGPGASIAADSAQSASPPKIEHHGAAMAGFGLDSWSNPNVVRWKENQEAAFAPFAEVVPATVEYDPYGDELYVDEATVRSAYATFVGAVSRGTGAGQVRFGDGPGDWRVGTSLAGGMNPLNWPSSAKETIGREVLAKGWAIAKVGPARPSADFTQYEVPVAVVTFAQYYKMGTQLKLTDIATWTITTANPQAAAAAAMSAAPSPPASAAETEADRISAIKEYKELLDQGVLTQEEFEAKKAELLGQ